VRVFGIFARFGVGIIYFCAVFWRFFGGFKAYFTVTWVFFGFCLLRGFPPSFGFLLSRGFAFYWQI